MQPHEFIYGQPHVDSDGIIVPWGCAALILIRSEIQQKFETKTVKVIFVSYALYYPTYTYGFLDATTGRIRHAADAIFITSEFPMRDARLHMGLPPDGIALGPTLLHRSPYAAAAPKDLTFD